MITHKKVIRALKTHHAKKKIAHAHKMKHLLKKGKVTIKATHVATKAAKHAIAHVHTAEHHLKHAQSTKKLATPEGFPKTLGNWNKWQKKREHFINERHTLIATRTAMAKTWLKDSKKVSTQQTILKTIIAELTAAGEAKAKKPSSKNTAKVTDLEKAFKKANA